MRKKRTKLKLRKYVSRWADRPEILSQTCVLGLVRGEQSFRCVRPRQFRRLNHRVCSSTLVYRMDILYLRPFGINDDYRSRNRKKISEKKAFPKRDRCCVVDAPLCRPFFVPPKTHKKTQKNPHALTVTIQKERGKYVV